MRLFGWGGGFEYVLFDIGSCLIELKGTSGPLLKAILGYEVFGALFVVSFMQVLASLGWEVARLSQISLSFVLFGHDSRLPLFWLFHYWCYFIVIFVNITSFLCKIILCYVFFFFFCKLLVMRLSQLFVLL